MRVKLVSNSVRAHCGEVINDAVAGRPRQLSAWYQLGRFFVRRYQIAALVAKRSIDLLARVLQPQATDIAACLTLFPTP